MKYILIKTYPGSPPLGTIVTNSNGDGNHSYIISGVKEYPRKIIEDNPEFWKNYSEELLFTTEDGVDIFEGDIVYSIFKDYSSSKIYIIKTPNFGGEGELTHNDFFNFSTKKAAENYILVNKPILSFNDVWNISNNKSSDNKFVIISKTKLRNLVKSKL